MPDSNGSGNGRAGGQVSNGMAGGQGDNGRRGGRVRPGGGGNGTAGRDRDPLADPPRNLRATVTLELRRGLAAAEVDRRVAELEHLGDVRARGLAFYLVDLADRGAHQELGFHSIVQYAQMRYGIRPATAREYLAVGRALEELPLIDEAFCAGKLLWSQVRLLVKVATAETESEWIEWARDRTVRELAAQARRREKGQRPTDPARRRIYTPRYKPQGDLNAAQMQMWNSARARLEAERGEPVSDTDLMMHGARLILSSPPDTSVPGREPVNASHFKVVVYCHEATGRAVIQTADGPVALDAATARDVLIESGLDDLAERVPDDAEPVDDANENAGPPVPADQRDRPTPPWLRAAVLARDGYRCRCCGSKRNLTGHHKKQRLNGGATEAANETSLCEGCHALTHDGKIEIRGRIPSGLRFLGPDGRDLDAPPPRNGSAAPTLHVQRPQDTGRETPGRPAARAATPALVTFSDVPQDVDRDWWSRHGHLLRWNDRDSTLAFEPGTPVDRPAAPEAADRSADAARAAGGRTAARAARPENAARAASLGRLVGQQRVVRNLQAVVRAARKRGEAVPHLLLEGPPGLGKTTIGRAVAAEAGGGFQQVAAPVVREPGVLLRLLVGLDVRDVLFVDELHRLPLPVAEVLYEAMEDRRLSLPVRCGNHQRTLHVQLAPFTLIGATTEPDGVPQSLLGRFQVREHVEFYSLDELAALIGGRAAEIRLRVTREAAGQLARASRDTPREALALLRSAADEAALAGRPVIDVGVADRTLKRLGIDGDGLRPAERAYLEVLARAGRPLGCSTLAARLDVSPRTLRRVYEPYLLRRGLVRLTPNGRAPGP